MAKKAAKSTAPIAPAAAPKAPARATASRAVVSNRAKAAAAAAAADESEEDAGTGESPKAMYKATKKSARFPLGYETRRTADEKDEARLKKAGFQLTTEGLEAEVPHGHEAI